MPRTPRELFLFLNQLQISSVEKKTLEKSGNYALHPFTISRYATAGPGCKWRKSGHWFWAPPFWFWAPHPNLWNKAKQPKKGQICQLLTILKYLNINMNIGIEAMLQGNT